MSWRNNVNTVDSGVFLMQHMESYVGQSVKLWDCDLSRGNQSQID